jgi:hypothetical protein
MRRRRLLASLVAMLLVGAAAPTSAVAAWTAPQVLSAPGQDADSQQVAIDSQGTAVFVWRRFDGANWRIQARARSAAGTLSPVQTLSAPGGSASGPQVAVDADGIAVFTWRQLEGPSGRIQTRARSANGTLSSVQYISASGQDARYPQVAFDADGDAVFAWQRFDGAKQRIQTRARSVTGGLSPVQTLSAAGQNARHPQVAIAPDGKALFTWGRFVPTSQQCCERIEARARSAGGALSPVQTLSPPPGPRQDAYYPQVGVDANGKALFSWQFVDSSDLRDFTTIQFRTRTAAGALSPVRSLAADEYVGGPEMAVNGAGDAVFAWDEADYATYPEAVLQARSRTGALSRVYLTRSAGDQAGFRPRVGLDGTGQAVIAWDRYVCDEINCGIDAGTAVQVRSASGVLSPLHTLSSTGFSPQVGVNGGGDAVVTWKDHSDGTNAVIQAAAGP